MTSLLKAKTAFDDTREQAARSVTQLCCYCWLAL